MSTQYTYQLRGYVVAPLSKNFIRDKAMYVRSELGLESRPVSLELFLEGLSEYGVTVDIVSDEDMPGLSGHSEAFCVPETATIYLTEETYHKACKGDRRTRFTIFHELGHLILGHSKQLHREGVNRNVKAYEDSEWQADQFAAEMTMPLDVIYKYEIFTAKKIEEFFEVSSKAAQKRHKQLLNEGVIQD